MAKRPCGTTDWLAQARMPDHVVVLGERHLRQVLHGLLQRSADPSILEQGCPGTATHSGRWTYPCEPNSRPVTPSLCSDLISDWDRGFFSARANIVFEPVSTSSPNI